MLRHVAHTSLIEFPVGAVPKYVAPHRLFMIPGLRMIPELVMLPPKLLFITPPSLSMPVPVFDTVIVPELVIILLL